MARSEFASRFSNSRNTGCTIRMLAGMGLGEKKLTTKLKRVCFADSWLDHPPPPPLFHYYYFDFLLTFHLLFETRFASLNTAQSVSDVLGMKFSGPIKTGSAGFPIESLRWTIANVTRGEHVVYKLMSVDNASVLVEEDCYAIGWSDHHLKCYLTTQG